MLVAIFMAHRFSPSSFLADEVGEINLEKSVPRAFGGWQVDNSVLPLVADPTANELANRIYSEVLTRTYISSEGLRVMLVIAYGKDQSEAFQVHSPEVCYPAQGFRVNRSRREQINLAHKSQPVVRLESSMAGRHEPITYWITMGEYVVNGGAADRRDIRFKYGFRGFVPDGMLVRVSSIGRDESEQYEIQSNFLNDLSKSLPTNIRDRIFGTQSY